MAGWPVYRYVKDMAPGIVNGQGLDGVGARHRLDGKPLDGPCWASASPARPQEVPAKAALLTLRSSHPSNGRSKRSHRIDAESLPMPDRPNGLRRCTQRRDGSTGFGVGFGVRMFPNRTIGRSCSEREQRN